MSRSISPLRALALAALFVAVVPAFVGCDDSNSPTAPRTSGTLAVRLTDAPVADATEVNVHIVGLTVKRNGSAAEKIANDLGTVDLLTLTNTSMLLATAQVGAGTYEFIQVELAENGSTVVDAATGGEFPLRIASREIKVLGGFTVNDNGTTDITLDFDAEASLRHLGNEGWLLTPVISQANTAAI